jgi:hypothetical protein
VSVRTISNFLNIPTVFQPSVILQILNLIDLPHKKVYTSHLNFSSEIYNLFSTFYHIIYFKTLI